MPAAIEALCSVQAAELEERGDLRFAMEIGVEIMGTSCSILQDFHLADSPLFVRDLRRDIFEQLVGAADVVFGERVVALRELIHFSRFSKSSQECLAQGSSNDTLWQQYDVVIELHQWPMRALANLTAAFFPRVGAEDPCVVALNLTSARVVFPVSAGTETHLAVFSGVVRTGPDEGFNPMREHESLYPIGFPTTTTSTTTQSSNGTTSNDSNITTISANFSNGSNGTSAVFFDTPIRRLVPLSADSGVVTDGGSTSSGNRQLAPNFFRFSGGVVTDSGAADSPLAEPVARRLDSASPATCSSIGDITAAGRRLHFVPKLQKCMLAHRDECLVQPTFAAARLYKSLYRSGEYRFFPGDDRGSSLASRTLFEEARARYFSHDIYPTGIGGVSSHEIFEVDTVDEATDASPPTAFSSVTNPTGEFENQFLALRNTSCSDLPDFATLPASDFGPTDLRFGYSLHERLCKLKCYRSQDCLSVDIGETFCHFRTGTVLDFTLADLDRNLVGSSVVTSTCFVKDTGQARAASADLRADGILEGCLFNARPACCPFLQTFFAACVEACVATGTGWLIRIGPVSDRFQTSAMPDAQSISQCE